MKCYQKMRKYLANSRGGVLVLIAILLFVLIGISALAIDIGYISTTKNELQNISDAAALGATGKLGQIYEENGVYDHGTDYADVRDVATTVGLTNRAAGLNISVAEADIEVGKWDFLTHTFDASETTYPNAVRVTTRRDSLLNGPINSLFAGIFGIDEFDVRVDAVAALSGQGKLDPGEVKLPIGVSERWFLDLDDDGEPDGCRDVIHLNDTGTACAGWHSYETTPTNTTELNKQIFGTILEFNESNENLDFLSDADEEWLLANYPSFQYNEGWAWLLVRYKDSPSALNYFTHSNPNSPIPFLTPGADANIDNFEFLGGVSGTLFDDPDGALQALFDFFKVRDEIADPPAANEDEIWRTTVPVYEDADDGCINPTQSILIVGAADIIVKGINPAPANDVDIEITCSYNKLRGAGGAGGVIGAIPNLVE
jgi:hypothetical protein